jgi:hypothetical protein
VTRRDRLDAYACIACIAAVVLYALAFAGAKWLPRYDCITFVVVLAGVFRVLAPVAPRARTLAVHVIAQVLAFALVDHLWTLGYEGRNAVFGGIVPWSDSYDYYDDAQRLVHGGRFGEVASKRPLFSAALAVLLWMSGGDLRFALLVCGVTGAAALAVATLELWRTHGARAAFVVFFVLVCFERRWTGFVQTEHVGLPLGALGFALCWRASRLADDDEARARRMVIVALFGMTVGLMARAGSFFVLPAIAIWGARRLTKDRRAALNFLGLAALAVALGFAVNKAVQASSGSGVTFSDYPGILYGLIHGEDYTYLIRAHPEVRDLPVAERVHAAWSILFADARAQPSLVVIGLAKSGLGLFASPFGMFSYVWTNPDDHVLENGAAVRASMQEHGLLGPLVLWRRTLGTYSLLNAGAMGLLAGAFVLAFVAGAVLLFVKRRKDSELSLLRHVVVGVVASAPFLPPWITSGMQVQTVTLAFVAAVPAVVLLGRRASEPLPGRDRIVFAPLAFVAALGALLAGVKLAPTRAPACPEGEAHRVRAYPSIAVEVAPARSALFRKKAEADLRDSIPLLAKHNQELTDSVVPYLRPGTVYVMGFDACDRHTKLLVVDDPRAFDVDAARGTWQPLVATPLATPVVLRVARVAPGAQRPVEP